MLKLFLLFLLKIFSRWFVTLAILELNFSLVAMVISSLNLCIDSELLLLNGAVNSITYEYKYRRIFAKYILLKVCLPMLQRFFCCKGASFNRKI